MARSSREEISKRCSSAQSTVVKLLVEPSSPTSHVRHWPGPAAVKVCAFGFADVVTVVSSPPVRAGSSPPRIVAYPPMSAPPASAAMRAVCRMVESRKIFIATYPTRCPCGSRASAGCSGRRGTGSSTTRWGAFQSGRTESSAAAGRRFLLPGAWRPPHRRTRR